MNPLDILEKQFIMDYNDFAAEIEKDLNSQKTEVLEEQKIEYLPTVKEYLDAFNQSRINKRSTAYWHYHRLYEEKRFNPEFSKYEGQDFGKLIKFDREFKKLLDSF